MNNKGFAITGIFYGILILFLTTIILMLFSLQNKKTVLDELKTDSVSAVECNDNMDYVLEQLSNVKTQLNEYATKMDNMYPIGSIYTSIDSKNPSEIFGGTWVSFGVGKTIVGTDTKSEATGGNSSVKLTAANIPSLTSTGTTTAKSVTTNSTGSGYSIGYGASTRTTSSAGTHTHTATHLGSTSGGSVGYIGQTGSISSNPTGSAGAHTHTYPDYYATSISGVQAHTHTLTVPALTVSSTYTNNSQTSISTIDPYITVYMWKRTA